MTKALLARRAQLRRMQPAPRARRERRWPWLLAILATALFMYWWMQPPPLQPPLEIEVPLPPAARVPVPIKKPLPPAPQPDLFARELLRKALLERAKELSVCELPPGSPRKAITRLRVAKSGPVRAIGFSNAEPLPKPLGDCLRAKMLSWTFSEVKLPADVDLLVNFDLGGR